MLSGVALWQEVIRKAIVASSLPSRFASFLRNWLGPVLLIFASLAVVVVHVPQHQQISPIDEYVYIDYLAKVPEQLVVHPGEETGSYARNYLSCHPVGLLGNFASNFCDTGVTSVDSAYPYNGVSSADFYTPIYFGATWVMAQPLHWIGIDDLTEAGRYTGFVWLVSAVLLFFFTLRRLKISEPLAIGLGLGLAGSIPAFWSNTYISTDSPALASGALMVYLLVRYGSRRNIGWALILSATFVTLIKIQNFSAVAVVLLTLLVFVVQSAFDSRAEPGWFKRSLNDRRLWTAALMVIVPVFFEIIWLIIRASIAIGLPADQGVGTPLTRVALFREIFSFFGGVGLGAVGPDSLSPTALAVTNVQTWLMVAGVLGIIVIWKNRTTAHALALSVLVVALALGPTLALFNSVIAGFYFTLPARYGLALMPIMLVCAAIFFDRKKTVSIPVGVVSAMCLVVSLRMATAL